MIRNDIERDLKIKLAEKGTNQARLADDIGVSSAYVNRIVKGREQIVNRTFTKMLEELGYDIEIAYIKRGGE